MIRKLNLGCGKKILNRFDNVDIQKGKGIYKTFNFNKFPYPIKDNTYDYILVDNVLEHLQDPKKVIEELHRISKRRAKIKIIVPYCRSILSYNDITHLHHFNIRAFEQIIEGNSSYGIDYKDKPIDFLWSAKLHPTFYGKLIPKPLRKYFDYLFNEIHDLIIVKMSVIK